MVEQFLDEGTFDALNHLDSAIVATRNILELSVVYDQSPDVDPC